MTDRAGARVRAALAAVRDLQWFLAPVGAKDDYSPALVDLAREELARVRRILEEAEDATRGGAGSPDPLILGPTLGHVAEEPPAARDRVAHPDPEPELEPEI